MLLSWWLDRNVDKGTVEWLATGHVRSGARVVAVGGKVHYIRPLHYSSIINRAKGS
jgi:hypothetical protein